MIRRTLRNGLVAALAAVAVFPVTAVASTTAPATPASISVPGWNTPPAAPKHHKAPKHHVRKHPATHVCRHRTATHARRHVLTPAGYHRVTRHTRHHLAARTWGRVTTHHYTRLNVRSGPGTGYRVVGTRPVGRTLSIVCETRGSGVFGNHRWYKLPHHEGYVSAHYVRDRSAVRWC
ncbi:SH3 domain-containing protein [Streptomyces sp. NPDC088350]|uniref:SH3 domain-containing protein n=1 Tax=Streptomyces sp. NPDC088350 TaxID=3365854 RepID=UPI0038309A6A